MQTLSTYVLGGLALLSGVLLLWQWRAGLRFFTQDPPFEAPFSPSITILKPLKGLDEYTPAALRTWLQQDYDGPVQILFGVKSADDPVCALVKILLAEAPHLDAALHICPEEHGPNAKVSTLVQLEKHARHDLICISDADVAVERTFLRQSMAGFRKPDTGLICSLYALGDARTLAMHLESLAVNVDFWSQVLQGVSLKTMDFALGAVMTVRSNDLRAIGGFESLVNYLADDYHLGRKISELGQRVELSRTVVVCRAGVTSSKAVWAHQLRWARTIRVCQPIPYFFSILSNPTLWPLLFALHDQSALALGVLAVTAVLRVWSAASLQRILNPPGVETSPATLIGLKDLLHVAVWASAFLGNTLEWRGQRFRALPSGELQKL